MLITSSPLVLVCYGGQTLLESSVLPAVYHNGNIWVFCFVFVTVNTLCSASDSIFLSLLVAFKMRSLTYATIIGFSAATSSKDDPTNFIGFHTAKEMPFSRSDMTATTFHQSGQYTKIYLVGGCVSNQICSDSFCYCPEITNKCTYYIPETNEWKTCADAPTPRYRHQGEIELYST